MVTRLACALLLSSLVSACGFQLRGSGERLPPQFGATWVDVPDRYSEFNESLREQLAASGARLVDDPAQATATIKVSRDEVDVRVLSVSARNTPREYEVVYKVVVAAGVGPTELMPAEPLTLTRNYAFDEGAVLVKDQEDRDIRRALADELASLVVFRLAAAARAAAAVPVPAPAPTAP
jgi:LPS-assembly lipoprotein